MICFTCAYRRRFQIHLLLRCIYLFPLTAYTAEAEQGLKLKMYLTEPNEQLNYVYYSMLIKAFLFMISLFLQLKCLILCELFKSSPEIIYFPASSLNIIQIKH